MRTRKFASFYGVPAPSLPMKLTFATLAVAALVATPGAGAGIGQGPPASYIVVFKNGVATDATTDALEGQMGFTARHRYHSALHGFAAPLTGAQLARIQQDADVAFVSEDRGVQATDALAPGETASTGVRRVNAATTTTTQGAAASVNVAVIDTGIGLSNTDLNAVSGTNCVNSGSAPEDDNGHGTHVSGTIAAKNTGSRDVGVAPNTKLYSVKVLNAQGSGTWAQVICGIDWVSANASTLNIHVASMSLGGSGSNDNNCGNTNGDALHLAICNSKAAGVTYVVAAGNSGADFSTSVPAAYPEAVTVTAVSDWDGQPGGTASGPPCLDGIFESDDAYASFSNYASTSDSAAMAHTIAAPGVCILSDWLSNGTNTISGTSMATPHVSGLVALCISAGTCTGGGSPSSIISAIQTTDSTKGFAGDPNHSPVSGRYYGYLAWFGGSGAPTSVTANPASSVTAGGATLNGSANPNGLATTAWFRYSTTNPVTCNNSFGTATSPVSSLGSGTSAQSYTFGLTALTPSTTYYYCAVASNSGGTTVASNAPVSFTTSAATGAPTSVTTNPASSVTAGGATLNGSANPNGLATTAWFRYSTTNPVTCNNSFGTATSPVSSLGSGTSAQSYTFGLTALTPSTTYYYCAVASNSGGTTVASNAPVSFTTPAATAPNPPTSLQATPATGRGVKLTWTASTTPGSSYNVYRTTATSGSCGSSFSSIASTSTTSYKDTSATRGYYYCYYVTAVNSGGESLPSNTAGPVRAS
jgi:subtilisin